MYLSLFEDARGELITCILCRISLPFFYMDLTAKLTGQLDFDPGGHAGVYVGQAARHTCWYRLGWTSNSRICEASFSPRLCPISTPWPSAQPLRTVVSRSCLDARRRSKFSSSNALRRRSGRLDTCCQAGPFIYVTQSQRFIYIFTTHCVRPIASSAPAAT